MPDAGQYPKPIYALRTGVSMTFWKKLYFATAVVGAVFLLLTLL